MERTMQVKTTNKDFSYTVKFLKKNRYTFDNSTKTWVGDKDISFLLSEGYVNPVESVSNEARLYNDMMFNPNSIN